ncbi:hypothetical protein J437_LFUL015789 [Ladona fulva]|uniref:Uncharacterized protein n=1 Tax=Ladona fulva TaxID=123851 RepID=A0A8K0KHS2_LADFU|nr:hypothetical protein J437_LFUL015789 [Ladona fulva]
MTSSGDRPLDFERGTDQCVSDRTAALGLQTQGPTGERSCWKRPQDSLSLGIDRWTPARHDPVPYRDSGYPLQPWLMTPISNLPPDSPEERYNSHHCRARNCVERCIGV